MLRIGVVFTNGGRRPPTPPCPLSRGGRHCPRRSLLLAIALAHPATAQPKTAPPVQYLPQTVLPPPSPGGQKPDLAFGAFQRGYFLTALQYATDGATAGNPPSMTLLGELYANGLGVPRDDAKAADWYKLAAARGDRNAMFALGLFAVQGRAGPRDRAQSAKWLAEAAKLGHPQAAYDLALLYIEGQLFPQDFKRAAELLRIAADAGSPQAQYALGTFYKDGRGVPKDMAEAVKLWAAAALADDTDAEVEYAIALYNGDGVQRDEDTAAANLLQGREAWQPHRARPLRAHHGKRARRPARSGQSGEMAPRLPRRRRDRHHARRFHGKPRRRDGGGGNETGAAVDRCVEAGAGGAGGADAGGGAAGADAGGAGEAVIPSLRAKRSNPDSSARFRRPPLCSVILRCEGSEPRRTTAPAPRPSPSRRAEWRAPQDDGHDACVVDR